MRCEQRHAEKRVAFSCKKHSFFPSCGARRMTETAATLADEVLPERPLRRWVLSLPHALRFQLASDEAALTLVLGVVYRAISRHPIGQAGPTRDRRDGSGDADTAPRFCAEPQRAVFRQVSAPTGSTSSCWSSRSPHG